MKLKTADEVYNYAFERAYTEGDACMDMPCELAPDEFWESYAMGIRDGLSEARDSFEVNWEHRMAFGDDALGILV